MLSLHKRQLGMTLIEAMTVVTIIAILLSIAYPAYLEQLRRGYRSEAQSALFEVQHFMERHYGSNSSYRDAATGVAPVLPMRLQTIPAAPATARYTVTLTASVSAFTVTAMPTAAMQNDRCGSFVLSGTGLKSVSGASSTAQECWR